MPRGRAAKAFPRAPTHAARPARSTARSNRTPAVCCTRSITTPTKVAGLPQLGPENVTDATRQFPFWSLTGIEPKLAGVLPASTLLGACDASDADNCRHRIPLLR